MRVSSAGMTYIPVRQVNDTGDINNDRVLVYSHYRISDAPPTKVVRGCVPCEATVTGRALSRAGTPHMKDE